MPLRYVILEKMQILIYSNVRINEVLSSGIYTQKSDLDIENQIFGVYQAPNVQVKDIQGNSRFL